MKQSDTIYSRFPYEKDGLRVSFWWQALCCSHMEMRQKGAGHVGSARRDTKRGAAPRATSVEDETMPYKTGNQMKQSEEKSIAPSKPGRQRSLAAPAAEHAQASQPAKAPVPRKTSAERQEQILRELAGLLGAQGAARASTSELARKVGVTEPALYRHFDSKAKMLSALIDFCQAGLEAIDGRGVEALAKAGAFMEANPSVARLMAGDGLSGEGKDLVERMEGLWVALGSKAYPENAGLAQAGCDWLRGLMARWVAGDRAESAMDAAGARAGLEAFGLASDAELAEAFQAPAPRRGSRPGT